MSGFGTIRYETSPDKVATIPLNRPEVLNAIARATGKRVRGTWMIESTLPAKAKRRAGQPPLPGRPGVRVDPCGGATERRWRL